MSAKPNQHAGELPAGPCDSVFQERFTYLETIVGRTPEEGIRKDLVDMKKVLHSMELRIYAALGGGLVILWLIEHATKA